jgi:hypothetical protein
MKTGGFSVRIVDHPGFPPLDNSSIEATPTGRPIPLMSRLVG